MNIDWSIFTRPEHRTGMFFRFDEKFSGLEKAQEVLNSGEHNIIAFNKGNGIHIFVIELVEACIILSANYTDRHWYEITQCSLLQKKEDSDIRWDLIDSFEYNCQLVVKSNKTSYKNPEAEQFTTNVFSDLSQKENYDARLEQIRLEEEEKKSIQDQIDMWGMCIDAEQKLLSAVDFPFYLSGKPIIKKGYFEVNISPDSIADADEALDEIKQRLGDDSIQIDKEDRVGLTLGQINNILEGNSKSETEITFVQYNAYCKVSIECERWVAGKFRNEGTAIKTWYSPNEMGYIRRDFFATNSLPKVIRWLHDVADFDDFDEGISVEDTLIWVSPVVKKHETQEDRIKRLEILNRKEIRSGKDYSDVILGTINSKESSYDKLKILLPSKDKKEYEKAIKFLQDNKDIKALYPFLMKDRELLRREREAMEKIASSQIGRLKNEELRNFIFNSSKARPTTAFEGISNIEYTDEYKDAKETRLLPLNDSQQTAVVKGVYASDLCLLQGPPGTGKTTVISELIWQHIRKKQDVKIMLSSQTNLAIDNALSRLLGEFSSAKYTDMWRYKTLIKPMRIADNDVLEDEGKPFTPERIQDWIDGKQGEDVDNNVVNAWIQNIALRVSAEGKYETILNEWKNALMHPDRNIRVLFGTTYKREYNILGMTCGKVGSSDFRKCEGEQGFDVVIIDEASKATPPELLMPLCYAKKSIIIGDHRQLAPVIRYDDYVEKLISIGTTRAKELAENLDKKLVKQSLFKRLITNPHLPESINATLNSQYRMHPQINGVIEQFYKNDKGGLHCELNPLYVDMNDFGNKESRYHGLSLPPFISPSIHTIWVDVPDGSQRSEGSSSYNEEEANTVALIIEKLSKAAGFSQYMEYWKNCGNTETYSTEAKLGIISFYAPQVRLIQQKIQSICDKNGIKTNVKSVDRFQGQERGIVIVSTVCTRGKGGFTKEPERLNVALSRARRLLIVVGNSRFYSSIQDENGNYLYREAIEKIKKNNGFIDYKTLYQL